MKRANIGLFVFGSMVVGTIACSSSAPPLQPAAPGDDDDSTATPTATAVASTTPPPAATATAVPTATTTVPAPVGTVPPINTNCATTTTALACGQCCFQQDNPLAGCACGAGSQCAATCGSNMCAGATPSLECVACLFTAQCNLSGLLTQGGAGAGLEQCLQASGCTTKALPGTPGN